MSWDIEVALANLQCRLISAHLGASRRISAHLRLIVPAGGSRRRRPALARLHRGQLPQLADAPGDARLAVGRGDDRDWVEQESCEQVMRSFNRAYPLHLDLEQEEADRCSDSVIECIGDALDDELSIVRGV